MFNSAPKSVSLSEEDRYWLLEQMGQVACAYAYAQDAHFGDRVAVNIEHLPAFKERHIALMDEDE
jgi:hypothetical protein